MRFLYGFIAFCVWGLFEVYLATKGYYLIPDDVAIISLAIVVAGAMAGG